MKKTPHLDNAVTGHFDDFVWATTEEPMTTRTFILHAQVNTHCAHCLSTITRTWNEYDKGKETDLHTNLISIVI